VYAIWICFLKLFFEVLAHGQYFGIFSSYLGIFRRRAMVNYDIYSFFPAPMDEIADVGLRIRRSLQILAW
jgi:hypothetical protein